MMLLGPWCTWILITKPNTSALSTDFVTFASQWILQFLFVLVSLSSHKRILLPEWFKHQNVWFYRTGGRNLRSETHYCLLVDGYPFAVFSNTEKEGFMRALTSSGKFHSLIRGLPSRTHIRLSNSQRPHLQHVHGSLEVGIQSTSTILLNDGKS